MIHSTQESYTHKDLYALIGVSFLVFFASCATHLWVLQGFPNSADEFDYLYQAHTFAGGRLSNPAHEMQQVLSPFYVLTHNERVFTLFPPGWPLILTIGVLLGIPQWINPILSAFIVLVLFFVAKLFAGRKIAWFSVLFLSLSPTFLFHAASYFSHTTCLLLILLCVLFLQLGWERQRLSLAIFAGFFAAFAFITREMTATALLVLPVLWSLWKSPSRSRFLLGLFIGAAPLIAFYLFYNEALTGVWFKPIRFLTESERIGFGERIIRVFDYVEVDVFGPAEAFQFTLRNLGRLLGWTFPALPLLALWGSWQFWNKHWTRLFTLMILMLIIAYFFYPTEGGHQYGPRFYFESLGFIALLAALGFSNLLFAHQKGNFLLALGLLVMLNILIYSLHAINLHRIIYERRVLERLIEHRQLNNAVVIVGTPVENMTQGDLIRNLPDWKEAPVIYLWDLGPRNREILKHFPERQAYFFRRNPQTGGYLLERIPS